MSHYLLFGWDWYEASGGVGDFQGAYKTAEAAMAAATGDSWHLHSEVVVWNAEMLGFDVLWEYADHTVTYHRDEHGAVVADRSPKLWWKEVSCGLRGGRRAAGKGAV